MEYKRPKQPKKQRILKNRLRKEQPDLCFIQETKCTVDRMETISKKQWSKYKMLVVEGQQMAGVFSPCGTHNR
jgi:exonuclease III